MQWTFKVLAVNADNAKSNDTQTKKLNTLDNSFEESNHDRCSNHTMQLSVKTLLAPFNTALSKNRMQDNQMPEGANNDNMSLEHIEEEDDNDNDKGEEEKEEEKDDKNDSIDELEELSESKQSQLLVNTAIVHEMVTKVSYYEAKNVCLLNIN